MAIILNGEYIVVESVTDATVSLRFHKDAAHRERFKTQTEDKYESTRHETRVVPVDLFAKADSKKTIRDNNIIAGYNSIRTLEEFAEGIDA